MSKSSVVQCFLGSVAAEKQISQTFKTLVTLTLSYGPQHQDARLLDDPVGVEEQAFQERQKVGQQVVTEHVCQHIQRCS